MESDRSDRIKFGPMRFDVGKLDDKLLANWRVHRHKDR